jgi:hypothetical protein
MTEININPDDRNSPIKFFPCRERATSAIIENKGRFIGLPKWRKQKLWTTWYVCVGRSRYLREDGSVY